MHAWSFFPRTLAIGASNVIGGTVADKSCVQGGCIHNDAAGGWIASHVPFLDGNDEEELEELEEELEELEEEL